MKLFGVRMNAANTVTITRMVFIPVFLVALLSDWTSLIPSFEGMRSFQPWIAALVFAILAATDGVDGYLARSRNQVTTFGKFLDPLADKLLVTAALLALVELGELPTWIAFVIVSREFIVSGLRMVASAEGEVIAASWYGKVKTVLQIIAIIMFLVLDAAPLSDAFDAFDYAAWAVMLAAVVMTILSMVDYFKNAASVLVGPWTDSPSIADDIIEAAESAIDDTVD